MASLCGLQGQHLQGQYTAQSPSNVLALSPIETTNNRPTAEYPYRPSPAASNGASSPIELKTLNAAIIIPSQLRLNIGTKSKYGFSKERVFKVDTVLEASQTMQAIRAYLKPSQAQVWYHRLLRCEEVAIYTAPTMVTHIVDDPNSIILTYIHGVAADRWLTQAFNNPGLLRVSGASDEIFNRFKTHLQGVRDECLLIGWKVKRLNLACLFGGFSAIATGVGVAAGVLCKDAGLGAAVGGTLVALLGVVLVLVFSLVQRDLKWGANV